MINFHSFGVSKIFINSFKNQHIFTLSQQDHIIRKRYFRLILICWKCLYSLKKNKFSMKCWFVCEVKIVPTLRYVALLLKWSTTLIRSSHCYGCTSSTNNNHTNNTKCSEKQLLIWMLHTIPNYILPPIANVMDAHCNPRNVMGW